MDILYLLIPLSTVIALVIIGVLGWAIARGQFDDLSQHGEMVFEPGERENDESFPTSDTARKRR